MESQFSEELKKNAGKTEDLQTSGRVAKVLNHCVRCPCSMHFRYLCSEGTNYITVTYITVTMSSDCAPIIFISCSTSESLPAKEHISETR